MKHHWCLWGADDEHSDSLGLSRYNRWTEGTVRLSTACGSRRRAMRTSWQALSAVADQSCGRFLRKSGAIALALTTLGAGFAGCGEDKAKQQRAEAAKRTKQQQAATRAKDQAAATDCSSKFQPFLTALGNVDSRLGIGLSFQDYSMKIGDAKVAYDQVISNNTKDDKCLGAVGLPSEKALNEYVKAYNIWNDCIQSTSCSTDSIKGELQKHWATAGGAAAKANEGLKAMKPQ